MTRGVMLKNGKRGYFLPACHSGACHMCTNYFFSSMQPLGNECCSCLFSPTSCALRCDHKLLVSAQAASGKSVVLKQLGIAAVRKARSKEQQPVLPLKIPLVAFGAMMGRTSERGTGLLWQYLSERENLARVASRVWNERSRTAR